MPTALSLSLIFLVGCSDFDIQPIEEAPAPEEEPCDIRVVETVPDQGATGVYYRHSIEFHLSDADPTATVVTDVPGVQWLRDETVVVFTPDLPLTPSTEYEVGLEFCGGSPLLNFQTSDVGSPLEMDTESLVDRTYSFELRDARYLEGHALVHLVSSWWSDHLMLQLLEVSDNGMAVRIAATEMGEQAEQDVCMRTVEPPPIAFTAPDIDVYIEELWFPAYQSDVTLYEVSLTGTFRPDGSAVEGVALSAQVDVRDLLALIGNDDPDDWEGGCDIAGWMSMPCGPCPHDGTSYCLQIEADQASAWEVDAMVEAIDEANAYPECSVWPSPTP